LVAFLHGRVVLFPGRLTPPSLRYTHLHAFCAAGQVHRAEPHSPFDYIVRDLFSTLALTFARSVINTSASSSVHSACTA
jgi:hypothetical protein